MNMTNARGKRATCQDSFGAHRGDNDMNGGKTKTSSISKPLLGCEDTLTDCLTFTLKQYAAGCSSLTLPLVFSQMPEYNQGDQVPQNHQGGESGSRGAYRHLLGQTDRQR